ncbi:MAG TPA: hypothetical protein VMT16_09590 [Thermoanaerobaculia bacterium]|nr:hypothetical protein [Thermoanaerobaculia bacterium]
MKHPARLALACLSVALLAAPAGLVKPGWPPGLKADEPAYWLMAESLAHDFDLDLGPEDRRRAFESFPYAPIGNLIVMSDDDWRTLRFGKPYIYSLVAAPLVRLVGANGLLVLNAALMLGMVWLGFFYLARYNREGIAALMATGFFLLSAGFPYVFWIHPEVLNMASVTACLYLAFAGPGGGASGWWRRPRNSPAVRAALSGAALVPAVYNKPMLALLGVAVLARFLGRRRLGAAGWWLGGAVAGMAVVVGSSWGLTGLATPYLGVARGAVQLCSPHQPPKPPAPLVEAPPAGEPAAAGEDPAAAATTPGEVYMAPRASWAWMFRVPRLDPRELAQRFAMFLWGRHTGLFLYFPFSLLALGLFLAHGRRSVSRWALLAATAAVALMFLLWIGHNWHGGGGFVGNRYFVNAYPALLFLVTRVRPGWLPLAGYGLGGLLLGPLLLTPFGAPVPWPTLQAHVRNAPFPLFPLELSLENIPGYVDRQWRGVLFRGRRDVFLPHEGSFWVQGATTSEVWLMTWEEPLDSVAFRVQSFAAPNQVTLRLGGERQVFSFGEGEAPGGRLVTFAEPRAARRLRIDRHDVYAYRLTVAAASGEVRAWTMALPPQECPYFPELEPWQEPFYVGAELLFVGDPEVLEREMFAVQWELAAVPDRVEAGATFSVPVRVRNGSAATWPADPPVKVQLAYHWRRPGGEYVVFDGLRTPLPGPVGPGERLETTMTVEAPREPGTYQLVLDLVLEHIAWFSQRGADVLDAAVEVLPASARPAPP